MLEFPSPNRQGRGRVFTEEVMEVKVGDCLVEVAGV